MPRSSELKDVLSLSLNDYIHCKHCGNCSKSPPDARFCPRCGTEKWYAFPEDFKLELSTCDICNLEYKIYIVSGVPLPRTEKRKPFVPHPTPTNYVKFLKRPMAVRVNIKSVENEAEKKDLEEMVKPSSSDSTKNG
ncbi:MAG: hypothetical protein AB1489_13960 [Acidobacteriota bacterium]